MKKIDNPLDGLFSAGGINVDLIEFFPDSYDNTLTRFNRRFGSARNYDMIGWDKYGVKIWRQNEGSFHCRKILGVYKFSWDELRDNSKEGIKIDSELKISPANLQRLLKLEGLKYKVRENSEEVKKRISSY